MVHYCHQRRRRNERRDDDDDDLLSSVVATTTACCLSTVVRTITSGDSNWRSDVPAGEEPPSREVGHLHGTEDTDSDEHHQVRVAVCRTQRCPPLSSSNGASPIIPQKSTLFSKKALRVPHQEDCSCGDPFRFMDEPEARKRLRGRRAGAGISRGTVPDYRNGIGLNRMRRRAGVSVSPLEAREPLRLLRR